VLPISHDIVHGGNQTFSRGDSGWCRILWGVHTWSGRPVLVEVHTSQWK